MLPAMTRGYFFSTQTTNASVEVNTSFFYNQLIKSIYLLQKMGKKTNKKFWAPSI